MSEEASEQARTIAMRIYRELDMDEPWHSNIQVMAMEIDAALLRERNAQRRTDADVAQNDSKFRPWEAIRATIEPENPT